MRGIGNGQRVQVYIIPEVLRAIRIEAAVGAGRPRVTDEGMLHNICSWLIINLLRAEATQFGLLCEQNLSNLWMKPTYRTLVSLALAALCAPAGCVVRAGAVCSVGRSDGHRRLSVTELRGLSV